VDGVCRLRGAAEDSIDFLGKLWVEIEHRRDGIRNLYIQRLLMLCYHLHFRGQTSSDHVVFDGDGRSFRLTLVLIFG